MFTPKLTETGIDCEKVKLNFKSHANLKLSFGYHFTYMVQKV